LTDSKSEYIPGTCNIGRKEIQRRKIQATIGLFVSVVSMFLLFPNKQPGLLRLIVFAPIFYTVLCFLQAKNKFCILFGITGVFNFNDSRKLTPVKEKDFHAKDRRKSILILFLSGLIAFIITIIYFYFPFL